MVTLGPGTNDTSVDAGLLYNASLGDRVWLDQNGNGVQDSGEPGIFWRDGGIAR
ncbi:MAG: SdrD B-like domain-containing protein [Kouleothrix sp.]